jgi:iron complex outermembrane receptor protein
MTSFRVRAFASVSSIASVLTLCLAPAFADAAETASVTGDDSELQEVVVTANKRAEDTREVPVSIGVIDGKELVDLHIENYEDISRVVPGVSFAAHNNGPNGPGQDNITIRGVSSTVGNPTVSSRISMRSRSPPSLATRAMPNHG